MQTLSGDNEENPSFRTKAGVCTITPEQIQLTRRGARGALSKFLHGTGSIKRTLAIQSILGFSFIAVGVLSLVARKHSAAIIPLITGPYFLLDTYRSRHHSAAPIIQRNAVTAIDKTAPAPPSTRGYFTVHFIQDNKPRKRLIILPGYLEDGESEFEKACIILDETGLLPKE